ncbi:hypothetical protein [Paraburkholderia phenoliruptrix]|uniref:hypothetical protein n=1 Tax=Paraburkholderia phenoliruptrix TaxID=252970 RepID=UPI001C6F500B|nr:hypothetical protein [Paraburkholderia phenoliruptrix]MBW9106274.1 hypothetical protein [Paraburkholderia phenoliruptrix]
MTSRSIGMHGPGLARLRPDDLRVGFPGRLNSRTVSLRMTADYGRRPFNARPRAVPHAIVRGRRRLGDITGMLAGLPRCRLYRRLGWRLSRLMLRRAVPGMRAGLGRIPHFGVTVCHGRAGYAPRPYRRCYCSKPHLLHSQNRCLLASRDYIPLQKSEIGLA